MKLFEFERLPPHIAYVRNIGKVAVSVAKHALKRMETRTKVTPEIFKQLLNRIPDVKNKFKPLDVNQEFKIWSKSLNVGLGMKRGSEKDGYPLVLVGTVLDKPLFDNVDDIVFYVG